MSVEAKGDDIYKSVMRQIEANEVDKAVELISELDADFERIRLLKRLALDLSRALVRGRARASDLDLAVDLARDVASALAHTLDPAYALDLALDLTHVLARALDLARVLARAIDLNFAVLQRLKNQNQVISKVVFTLVSDVRLLEPPKD